MTEVEKGTTHFSVFKPLSSVKRTTEVIRPSTFNPPSTDADTSLIYGAFTQRTSSITFSLFTVAEHLSLTERKQEQVLTTFIASSTISSFAVE